MFDYLSADKHFVSEHQDKQWLQVSWKQYLQVWEAVVKEDMPSVKEELLLADTQQARHQWVKSLGGGQQTLRYFQLLK